MTNIAPIGRKTLDWATIGKWIMDMFRTANRQPRAVARCTPSWTGSTDSTRHDSTELKWTELNSWVELCHFGGPAFGFKFSSLQRHGTESKWEAMTISISIRNGIHMALYAFAAIDFYWLYAWRIWNIDEIRLPCRLTQLRGISRYPGFASGPCYELISIAAWILLASCFYIRSAIWI